jgi:hypothetical protein
VILLKHTKTVPVNSRAVVLIQILHFDLDGVTPAGLDEWSGVCSVNELCTFGKAIWSNFFLGDFKVVLENVNFDVRLVRSNDTEEGHLRFL